MPTETIIIGLSTSAGIERVPIEADRTSWTHDDTLKAYESDTEVGEFPNALFAVRAENLED